MMVSRMFVAGRHVRTFTYCKLVGEERPRWKWSPGEERPKWSESPEKEEQPK
jgi:hypothetical protein